MPPEKRTRSGSSFRTVLSAGVVILGVAVALLWRGIAQKHTTFDNDDATTSSISIGVASRDVQVSAEQSVGAFLEDLRHQDYSHALAATANDFPAPHSVDSLKSFTQRKQFSPIFGGALKFEPAHVDSHGQKMIMRATLQSGGVPYNTVCSFTKKNGVWRISSILDPVPPGKRSTVQAGQSVKSQ